MGHSSYCQVNFLGGEWAAEVQGRSDVDTYKTGLNQCVNYYPIEQGSLQRRQGLTYVGHTKAGVAGRVKGFDLAGNSLQLEFTDGFVRFIRGTSYLPNGVVDIASISTAKPAVVTTKTAHGFSNNDTIYFTLQSSRAIPSTLFNRQFVITVLTGTTFSIADAITTEAIDGSTIGWNAPLGSGTYTTTRIAELATPYVGGDWAGLTFVQDEGQIILFHTKYATRTITQVSTGFGFSIGLYVYLDGPYLDINATTTTLTPSGSTGSITVTASSVVGVNGGLGFLTTDVGRSIRMYNAPAPWDKVKADYAVGDQVLYVDGNSYVALKAGSHQTGVVPTNIDHWALLSFLPYWTWMIITARNSTTQVVATIQQSTSTTSNSLFNTLATKQWQLGLYTNTISWPTCGTYREGRLWLAGVIVNRVDGSVSNQYTVFSPTGDDGTVADSSAISGIIKANENNPIQWLADDDAGLIFGTSSSEWKIKASNLDDPLTPSSSTPRRLTKWGSALGVQPVVAHKMHLFVQRMGRKIIELGHPGAEGGALYTAMEVSNLSLTASHLSASGIAEIVFCDEPKPFVWARRNDGILVGMTYIRDANKLTAGWHQHPLGHSRLVESISSGPSTDQFTSRLYAVTNDPSNSVRWVEMLTDVFDDNKKDYQGFFVDGGLAPASAKVTTVAVEGFDGVRFYGYWPMIGKTLSAYVGGLDLGDKVVDANGFLDYPFTSTFHLGFLMSNAPQYGTQGLIDGTAQVVASTYPNEANKLLCYNSPNGSIVGVSGLTALLDISRSHIVFLSEGNGNTNGFRVFPNDTHGTESQEITRGTVYGSTDPNFWITSLNGGGGAMLDYDGYIYDMKLLGNTFTMAKINPTSFKEVGNFSVTFGPDTFNYPSSTTPLRFFKASSGAARNFMTVAGSRTVLIMDTDAISRAPATSVPLLRQLVDEGLVVTCSGQRQTSYGTAYALGFASGLSAAAIGLYEIKVSETITGALATTTMTKLGTVTPAQVDATWTNFSSIVGMAFDRLDGNVIIMCQTTDAVTNKQYVVKLNANTAAVMWKAIVNSIDAYGNGNMNKHWIDNGQFAFLSATQVSAGVYRIYNINTATGAITNQDVNNVVLSGGQIFDSRSGTITFYGSYGPASAPPTLIGDYFGVPNTTYTNQWGRIGTTGGSGGSTQPYTPQATYSLSAPIGFTYTSKGQLLRPDHGQDSGARNGPAFGKIRRNHWFAALLNRTQDIKFGIDFGSSLHAAKLTTKGGTTTTPLPQPALFSGVITDTVSDDYTKEGMVAWQQNRPVPGQILVIGGYIESMDK